jgi:RecA-family ATPase
MDDDLDPDLEDIDPYTVPPVGKGGKTPNGHPEPEPEPPALAFNLADWNVASAFAGEAPTQKWLVGGTIPMGVGALVAAAGDAGKSYTALELCDRVSMGPVPGPERPILGGLVETYGAAVFVTAEDAKGSVHRRIRALDPDGARSARRQHPLYVVPLPDAGGPIALVTMERGKLTITEQYWALRAQLKKIPNLAVVVFDPLQVFVLADVNADPMVAAFVMALFNRLAAETGATVIALHHVRKDKEAPKNLQEARHLIRGTSALVDQARVAVVLWSPADADIRKTCKHLKVDHAPNAIVLGGVVKANDGASRKMWTLHRQPSGLLRDVSVEAAAKTVTGVELEKALVTAIADAAKAGRPYTKMGVNGLHQRRAELGGELPALGRNKLEELAQELEAAGKIVTALASGTTVKWLDVPDGPFARGEGVFARGAGTAKAGRKAC